MVKLSKILGLDISTRELDKRVKEIEKFRTTLQQMMRKAMDKSTQEKSAAEEELRYIG